MKSPRCRVHRHDARSSGHRPLSRMRYRSSVKARLAGYCRYSPIESSILRLPANRPHPPPLLHAGPGLQTRIPSRVTLCHHPANSPPPVLISQVKVGDQVLTADPTTGSRAAYAGTGLRERAMDQTNWRTD